jgi:hypothetical protein
MPNVSSNTNAAVSVQAPVEPSKPQQSAATSTGSADEKEDDWDDRVFDVCIIGAGPQALAVLSSLHEPYGTLTGAQLEETYRRSTKHGNRGDTTAATSPGISVCVVDPGGDWLVQWRSRFAALEIEYLR